MERADISTTGPPSLADVTDSNIRGQMQRVLTIFRKIMSCNCMRCNRTRCTNDFLTDVCAFINGVKKKIKITIIMNRKEENMSPSAYVAMHH